MRNEGRGMGWRYLGGISEIGWLRILDFEKFLEVERLGGLEVWRFGGLEVGKFRSSEVQKFRGFGFWICGIRKKVVSLHADCKLRVLEAKK